MKKTMTTPQRGAITAALPNSSSGAQLAENIILRIVGAFTFHPDEQRIIVENLGDVCLMFLKLHQLDIRLAIGKSGKHYKALCSIVELISRKYGVQLQLEIPEHDQGPVQNASRWMPGVSAWDAPTVIQLVKDVCTCTLDMGADVDIQDSAHSTTSVMKVRCHPKETLTIVDKLNSACQDLFLAIGRKHGRVLLLDMKSKLSETMAA